MTIPTNVTQLLIGNLVFERSPKELVQDARFYLGWRNSTLLVDPSAAAALTPNLTRRGEIVEPMPFLTTGVQLVAGEPGALEAAGDPRKGGSGMAVP
jgi:gamma-glutamyltranspeptidase